MYSISSIMKVSQNIKLALLLTMCILHCTISCPLPGDTCTTLPEDDFSYDEYLDNLPIDNQLKLNATRTDLAFSAHSVRSAMATATLADITPGCEERNFNFSLPVEGADGAPNIRCPFMFVCDYNPQRVPAQIFHARCTQNELSDGTKCREVFYPVATMTTESCDPLRSEEEWLLKTEMVAVSCIAAQ